MIKAQQQHEETAKPFIPPFQEDLKELEGKPFQPEVSMSQVRAAYPNLKDHLMYLLKSEICHEVLLETGVGKVLKLFHDYCVCYEEDMPELQKLIHMCDMILQKWKNFVLNTIFDEQKDNTSEFIK